VPSAFDDLQNAVPDLGREVLGTALEHDYSPSPAMIVTRRLGQKRIDKLRRGTGVPKAATLNRREPPRVTVQRLPAQMWAFWQKHKEVGEISQKSSGEKWPEARDDFSTSNRRESSRFTDHPTPAEINAPPAHVRGTGIMAEWIDVRSAASHRSLCGQTLPLGLRVDRELLRVRRPHPVH
jgi:hypothetical protein